MKKIIVRQHQHKLPGLIDLENNTISIFSSSDASNIAKYEILDDNKEDVIYIANRENGEIHSLVKNPITKEYWICRDDKVPYIAPGSPFKAIVCDSLKFVCFSIPRNGSSSILASAMIYDNKISMEDYYMVENDTVWPYANKYLKGSTIVSYAEGEKIVREKKYKAFIIFDDSIGRYIRYLNWELKSKQIKYFNYDACKKDFIAEHLWALPLLTSNKLCCDAHCLPTEAFAYQITLSIEDNELELWWLDELPATFQKTFDKPLVINHISKVSEKVFSEKDLDVCEQFDLLTKLTTISDKWL